VSVSLYADYQSGLAVAIDDPSKVGEARRSANAIAKAIGLSETDAGKFAILASEAATNITKHAGNGHLVLRSLGEGGAAGVEVVAIDQGPGIPDLDRALSDGYSTAGSSGTGLGAMSRLASVFDIYTSVGSGTALVARITRTADGGRVYPFDVGVVRVPKDPCQPCVRCSVDHADLDRHHVVLDRDFDLSVVSHWRLSLLVRWLFVPRGRTGR